MPQLRTEPEPLLPPVVLFDLPEIAEEATAPPPPMPPPPPPQPKPDPVPPPEPPPPPKAEPKPPPPPPTPRVVPKPAPPVEPVVTKPPPPPPVNVAPKADPVLRARYEQALSAWFERYKEYPVQAQRRRMEGRGVMKIRIDRDGRVLASAISENTKYSMLDDAMKKMVSRADPFPPMPDSTPGDSFEFVAPVTFNLR